MKSIAKEIETKICAGADCAELAKRYSQDVESSHRGGLMPPVDWKMTLSSDLNDTVFHLALISADVCKQRDGTFNTFLEEEPPFLADAASKLNLFETAGPIEYTDPAKGKQYAPVKCMATRGGKQLSYNDVEKTIGPAFTDYYWDRNNKATIERLKKKYTIKIYQDALQQNLSSIGISPQR